MGEVDRKEVELIAEAVSLEYGLHLKDRPINDQALFRRDARISLSVLNDSRELTSTGLDPSLVEIDSHLRRTSERLTEETLAREFLARYGVMPHADTGMDPHAQLKLMMAWFHQANLAFSG